MKRKNVVIGIIVAMILIAMAFALVSLFSGSVSVKALVLRTIELRNNFEDPVARAQAITDINAFVSELNDQGINEGWRSLAACIPEGCTDDDYMNFIMSAVSAQPKKFEHSMLIRNLIKVHRYWGDKTNVIIFSQALTDTNNMINELHFSTAANVWSDIVACNGECEDYDNRFFKMIKVIVEL